MKHSNTFSTRYSVSAAHLSIPIFDLLLSDISQSSDNLTRNLTKHIWNVKTKSLTDEHFSLSSTIDFFYTTHFYFYLFFTSTMVYRFKKSSGSAARLPQQMAWMKLIWSKSTLEGNTDDTTTQGHKVLKSKPSAKDFYFSSKCEVYPSQTVSSNRPW